MFEYVKTNKKKILRLVGGEETLFLVNMRTTVTVFEAFLLTVIYRVDYIFINLFGSIVQ